MSTAWVSKILNGVEVVEYKDCIPGSIVVSGKKAQAILTNKEGQVLIAAAEYGKGRVVVFSHNTFVRSFTQTPFPRENATLLSNIKSWVSRDKAKGDSVQYARGYSRFDEISRSKLLAWDADEKNKAFQTDLLKWLEIGGGLVCGICPWGHAQVTKLKVEEFSISAVMKAFGLSFHITKPYFSTKDRLSVSENCLPGAVARLPQKVTHDDESKWRKEILDKVTTVEFAGCVPGLIIVYGKNADAILTNSSGEVLLAGAEFGHGRVVVASHNYFINSFANTDFPQDNWTLLNNIKTWLSRGDGDAVVQTVRSADQIPLCKVLAWDGEEKSEPFLNQLLTWVEQGGGLFCGVCPWGHAQVTGIPVEKFSLSKFLSTLGMAYSTNQSYFSSKDTVNVDENCADQVRLDKALNVLKQNGDLSKVRKTLGNITCLEDKEFDQIKPVVTQLAKQCPCVPSKVNSVCSENGKVASSIMNQVFVKDAERGSTVRAYGIRDFPGDFTRPPKLETINCTVKAAGYRCHPTGCYLPAGVEMVVTWKDGIWGDGWAIVVGAHRDELFNVKGGWRRWPKVSIKKPMTASPLKMSNPFGGLVYVESPEGSSSSVRLQVNNVVPAPRFTYDLDSQWESVESKKEGLWCDISGDLITFTLPSDSVRHLRDLTDTMKLWDEVVRAHIELRGCDASGGRGQWVVTDEQPSAGYMHSGYPIVTHLDVADPNKDDGDAFLLNRDRLKNINRNGFWGMFHELGHNFQDSSWTWEGTGEVTVNIFTLHAMDVFCGVKPWIHPWLAGQMDSVKKYLQSGANFETWKADPGVALTIYAQHARDLGWDAYKRVFREYNSLPASEKPKTYNDQISQWITRFSRTAGRNLCPSFEFWGFPVDEDTMRKASGLPPYLPEDETTKKMAPGRAKTIAKKYKMSWK